MSKRNGSKGHNHNGNGQQPRSEGTQQPPVMKFPVPAYYKFAAAGVKIVVGLPLERSVSHIPFMHFLEMQARGCWPTFKRFYSRTDVNRNEFARLLLNSDFTHLAMLDTDHLHAPDVIEKMARHVIQDPTKTVIGGLHFRRGEPFEPCAFFLTDDGKYHAPAEWPRALMKVDILGHGTMLIHRSVFETIPGPWWCYEYVPFDDITKPQTYPSEDVYFSKLCGEHGIKLWCDTTITSPHQTESWVDEDTFRNYLAQNPHSTVDVKADGVAEAIEDAVPEMPGIPELAQ